MPKPSLPVLVDPNFEEFAMTLDERARESIAATLGQAIPDEAVAILEDRIKKCRAGLAGNTATPGKTIVGCDALVRGGETYAELLEMFTAKNSGVDAETVHNLKPFATKILERIKKLKQAALRESKRLKQHDRVNPKHEVLKMHCGLLRLFFHQYAHPGYKVGYQARTRLRGFVRVVCASAGIGLPKRTRLLDELIETNVPDDVWPRWAKGVGT